MDTRSIPVTISSMTTLIENAIGERELSSRISDGIHVSLLWDPATDRLRVAVLDARLAHAFDFPVEGDDAVTAFQHPFAYAAQRGLLDDLTVSVDETGATAKVLP
jgi:hypothetical protein